MLKGKESRKSLSVYGRFVKKTGLVPIIVFSAPMGTTDALIGIGESYAQSCTLPLAPVFEVYRHLAKDSCQRTNGKNKPWRI